MQTHMSTTALQMSAVTSQLTAVAAITTNVQHRKDNKLATDQVQRDAHDCRHMPDQF